MVSIPGLPPHLAVVPPSPFAPDDPDADAKRRAWRVWRYNVQVYRTERHRDLRTDPDLIPFELMKCATHPAYWAAVWLRVFEPRWRADPNTQILAPIGEEMDAIDDPDIEVATMRKAIVPDVPWMVTQGIAENSATDPNYDPALAPVFGYIPFICFADQVDVINQLLWTLEQDDENADAVWSKCRGWGASWIGCLIALWGWSFSHYWPKKRPFNVLMLSRKEEYVDSKLQRSLFWKIRRLMRDMPDWQMPKGWNPDFHDQKGVLINPENGNEIGGESTNTKAGRGDRVTFAWIDEAAAIADLLGKWSTLAETTDHRWAVSTESLEEGPDFYNLRTGEEMDFRPYLIESEWFQNPLNDDEWYERQKRRYAADPDAFDREILRKPHGSGNAFVYPWVFDKALDPDLRPAADAQSYVSADPGYRDPTALVAIQETADGWIDVLDSYSIAGKEADYFVPILDPRFFAHDDPAWREREHISWRPYVKYSGNLGGERDGESLFEYDLRAITFATTVAAMTRPTYVGDTYGDNTLGATKDSIYSRWRVYGINANPDRKTGEQVTKQVKINRTFDGRKQAMNERASRLRFATTLGARAVLKAMQNYMYEPNLDKNRQNEPKTPLHSSASHLTTAVEFFMVKAGSRKRMAQRELAKSSKPKMGGQISNFGKMRNTAHLRGTDAA